MHGPLTLQEIVARLGGELAGNGKVLIRQVGTLERAEADQITFLANPRYAGKLAETRAGAIILGRNAAALTERPRVVCENPYAYFARVSQLFNAEAAPEALIHPTAHVDAGSRVARTARVDANAVVEQGAAIGERVWIGAGCYVGRGSAIGDDTRLHPSVTVYHGCRIGARGILHAGVVVGADGFGLAPEGGRWLKIPQIGGVVIGDDVEIGANTTIDRGAMDDTVIEDGVKLDNQIQIGHNVRIGAHTAMAGCVGVAGSTQIGKHCMFGGAAMVLGHLRIADHVQISACTVVSRSISKAGTYSGFFPLDEHSAWTRNAVALRHLSELAERVRALEKLNGGDRNDE